MEQFKYHLIPRRNVKKNFPRVLEIYVQFLFINGKTWHVKVFPLVNRVIQLRAVLSILGGAPLYLVLIIKNSQHSENVVTIL